MRYGLVVYKLVECQVIRTGNHEKKRMSQSFTIGSSVPLKGKANFHRSSAHRSPIFAPAGGGKGKGGREDSISMKALLREKELRWNSFTGKIVRRAIDQSLF